LLAGKFRALDSNVKPLEPPLRGDFAWPIPSDFACQANSEPPSPVIQLPKRSFRAKMPGVRRGQPDDHGKPSP
jgi:hypothetical protein